MYHLDIPKKVNNNESQFLSNWLNWDGVELAVAVDEINITEMLLHEDERKLISNTWSMARRKTFILGRLAGKQAMNKQDSTISNPILKGPMGEPLFPQPFKGSISHKDSIAVSAVCCSPYILGIGIDIEQYLAPSDLSLIEWICSDEEVKFIGNSTYWLTCFFSLKEAVLKAYFMVNKVLLEMKEINCCHLLFRKGNQSNIKINYFHLNGYVVSLCIITHYT